MKILVLSLLRLGDIIQQVPLFSGLREKYPGAEIHLLLNKQFKSVEKILEGRIDRYIYFDRESLQKGLGEAGYNILWSYTQVENLIEELNQNSYAVCFNFTHNKLSAYLLGALDIPEKKGLYQQDGRFQGLANRWLRYFNERFSGTQISLFHYVEILSKSFGIPVKASPHISKKKSKLILFQCLTSNSKKNWSLQKFYELKRSIEIALVDYKICVLGAPFEKEALLKVFPERDLLICDLVDARKHLQNADLLVTGDTSIKHLAAQTGTPIVEIALGSSDPKKTSAYSNQSIVLASNAPCAPCSHSQSCSQSSHICEEDITVHKVFSAVWDQLSGEKLERQDLLLQLDRATWSLYLDKNNAEVDPLYKDAAQDFLQKNSSGFLKNTMPVFQAKTNLFLGWLEKALSALPSREILMSKKNFTSSDLADLIFCAQEIIKSKEDTAGYFQSFVEALLSRFSHPLQIHDRISKALMETEELLKIRQNLTYHLQLLSEERVNYGPTIPKEGAYYAKGIGQLSIGGFEEARDGIPRNLENTEL